LNVASMVRNIILVCGIVLLALTRISAGAQKSSPPAQGKSVRGGVGRGEIWKSKTSGREYRVKIEQDRFLAEWVNIAPTAAKQGAYIRTECRRSGTKWIGTSQVLLPCAKPGEAKGKTTRVCPMRLRFEVDSISPERISGHGENLRDFDCEKCEVRQTGWGAFEWVPKR